MSRIIIGLPVTVRCEWSVEEADPDGGVEDTGADLDAAAGAPFDFHVHQFGDDIRIAFIKGIIDRLVKGFRVRVESGFGVSCARGVRHSVQRWPGRIQGSWMQRGRGPKGSEE